jgi:dolichyl-diphosphooligosaccharide--protein glycosyltransferase
MRLLKVIVLIFFVLVFSLLTMSGATKWSGRSLTLIDTEYAKNYMPLIASVAEHAPSMWLKYF